MLTTLHHKRDFCNRKGADFPLFYSAFWPSDFITCRSVVIYCHREFKSKRSPETARKGMLTGKDDSKKRAKTLWEIAAFWLVCCLDHFQTG